VIHVWEMGGNDGGCNASYCPHSTPAHRILGIQAGSLQMRLCTDHAAQLYALLAVNLDREAKNRAQGRPGPRRVRYGTRTGAKPGSLAGVVRAYLHAPAEELRRALAKGLKDYPDYHTPVRSGER
jgi:hypothetical protein